MLIQLFIRIIREASLIRWPISIRVVPQVILPTHQPRQLVLLLTLTNNNLVDLYIRSSAA
jgi:hypothetical protein